MAQWSSAPSSREQLVLFPVSLDGAIPPDHPVRFVNEFLKSVDWTSWEAQYHGHLGQPAIHPSVLASVLLYGFLTRTRSSRRLEEALQLRLDFRWLASGRTIDHTTLCKFRIKHAELIKSLFVQIVQTARELELVNLQRLAYDGTRVRSNNRRSGTRSPEQLRQERADLQAQYDQQLRDWEAADLEDKGFFESVRVPPEALLNLQERIQKVTEQLECLDRLADEGRSIPKRMPITDPDSRVMPNKEGGFAPNYTPLATVDVDSGLIVGTEVLNQINEDSELIRSIEAVRDAYALDSTGQPQVVLADTLNGTGANLAGCNEANIDLYAPIASPDTTNPALRADPRQPVPESEWGKLPLYTARKGDPQLLDKSAFVYDEQANCYWCPLGKPLSFRGTTSEKSGTGRRVRSRYEAKAEDCATCPLRAQCVSGQAKFRRISHEQHEAERKRHAEKMATPQAKDLYKQRRHAGERPFGVIKHQFGVRQFLLRRLPRVRLEWYWATMAFNLHRLFHLIHPRPGPASD